MRILVLVAPGGEATRAAVSGAVAGWNRGLDFRLRFLNIGLEEAVLVLADPTGDPGAGLVEVERAIARVQPVVALLHGRGAAALAAAITAARAGLPLVRTAAGLREGPGADFDRAADGLCSVLLAEGEAAPAALSAEGLASEPFTPDAAVKAVIRLHQEE